METVWLFNPLTAATVEVPAGSAPSLERHGWQMVDDPDDTTELGLRGSLIVVVHGTNPAVARPSGAVSVMWIGTVDPTLADDDRDIWLDPTF